MEIFSAELADSQLQLSWPGFEPCFSQKSSHIVADFLQKDGQTSRTSAISEPQTFRDGEEQLTFFQEVFHASHSVLPGNKEARQITETSGRQCAMLCPRSGLFGSFVKTCLESLAWGNSNEFVWIWNTSVTRHNRLLFRLMPLGQSTEENGCSLWRTPNAMDYVESNQDGEKRRQDNHQVKLVEQVKTGRLWPTPDAKLSCSGPDYARANREGSGGDDLTMAAKLWPTPHAADGTGGGSPIRHDPNVTGGRSNLRDEVKLWPTPMERDWKSTSHGNQDNARPLSEMAGLTGQGSLNPVFVEWLMMFPLGWTDLQCPLRSPGSEFQVEAPG